MKSCVVDEDGLRHLLLCRVILGKMEVVHPGSQQYHPSSEDFDSGVDNLPAPKKYIVWSTHMNTHILPEYAVTFRAPPCLKGEQLYNTCLFLFPFRVRVMIARSCTNLICALIWLGFLNTQGSLKKPTSPWMPFTTLISVLSKFLPPQSVNLIAKHHRDHRVSSFQVAFDLWWHYKNAFHFVVFCFLTSIPPNLYSRRIRSHDMSWFD